MTRPEPIRIDLESFCAGCMGCGRIADDRGRTPWVFVGQPDTWPDGYTVPATAKPKLCPTCEGRGSV